MSGSRVVVAALLYAPLGEEVQLIRYRAGRDGFLPELVTGVLVGCTGTEWILTDGATENRYPFDEWEYCIGPEGGERTDTGLAKTKADQPEPAGRLRSSCNAVRTRNINDPAVADIHVLSPSARTGKRTCSACGARQVTMLQTLRHGAPIQAWQYTRHFPPLSPSSPEQL